MDSALLQRAYVLAAEAHGSQRRATDRHLFVEHVVEVAGLLHDAGFDEELIAVGLLHDAVERGTATEAGVRAEMGGGISSLVMALTEDRSLESFAERKQALRDQVGAAGPRAIAVFAADKLSDIRGLRRGIDTSRDSIEARMGTTIAAMAGHYRESVLMIEASDPSSCFVPALRRGLSSLTTATR
jgi:(p)ppGpp synthase/HD superfamily hydrolase